MARDRFEREIDYIRVSVTDLCDLGCVYCTPGAKPMPLGPASRLGFDEIVRIVRAAIGFGVRKVRLTGGEPLMRQDIVELVAAIKGLGVEDLSLTTNGQRLSSLARDLKAAGLDRLNVSLDTMKPDRYSGMTGGGALGPVLEGIEAARGAGLDPIKINMVPLRGRNDDEVVDFARMTIESPAHIRFIELMPTRRGWNPELCLKSHETMQRIEAGLGPLEQREFKGRGPSRNFVIPGALGIIGFISPVSHSFCYCCNRLRITSAGKIKPCLFSSTEIDLLSPMRQGASDEEVARLIALAIDAKPEGNYLVDPGSASLGEMSKIGG